MIHIEAVNHYYGSGEQRRQILYDIHAQIAGEVVMLRGPSGSGKSTLLTLIGALRSVQEGRLRIVGRDLSDASADALVEVRRQIGFIFQHHNLLGSLTAAQNVATALSLQAPRRANPRSIALAMLDRVGLSGCGDRYPSQMSGGQRQRVSIARALVTSPPLILADEPTAALDRHSGLEAVSLIVDLVRQRGSTALIVTHDDRILHLADRVLCIEDGQLKEVSDSPRTMAA